MTATVSDSLGCSNARENLADIKMEDIDFEAVEECRSAAKLARYITLLEADGGYFKELLNKAKEKLMKIDRKAHYKLYPNSVKASPEEITSANSTVLAWEQELKSVDKEAKHRASEASTALKRTCPIREVLMQNRLEEADGSVSGEEAAKRKSENPYARDMTAMKDYYTAWDRFDVEAACDAVEESKTENGKLEKVDAAEVTYEQDWSAERVAGMSSAERAAVCESEKIKGNECFTSGDLTEAELHYSTAIRLCPDISVVWSNRALVRLKLRRPKDALEDAQRAIALDRKNVKAFHRRGKARTELGYLDDAVKDFQIALKLLTESGAEEGMIAKVNADLATTRRKLMAEQREKTEEENEEKNEPKIQEIFDEPPVNSCEEDRTANFKRIAVDLDDEESDVEERTAQGNSTVSSRWKKIEVLDDSSDED
ncbi:hypothetical protein FOL47_002498 [Perkinsus chesapeaki]|uniref:RNA polymerase II-associated protein 3 n=1 Tax=Perkinsus chesapeaki TaxID=330153 RepID=A0A7J6N048_PERCH|nr:hypothetical protein FOL47_002498 [Perkinsus chesapeaki]